MDDEPEEGAERGAVEVPIAQLSPEALAQVIADIITRDGTDYGAVERTFEQKAVALRRQLEQGHAKLVFDLETKTVGVMTAVQLERARREQATRERDGSE